MSFQQGLSGLNASSKSLEVTGNNIANANTYGAKSSRAEFADMYAAALGGGGTSNIGIGVSLSAVAQQFTQGNVTSTGNAMDLAINGAGFFQVSDGGSTLYTRNGQFKVDNDGYIVNNQKQQLLGYPADVMGVIQPGTSGPIQLPTAGITPSATTKMIVEMNLDSRAAVTNPTSVAQANSASAAAVAAAAATALAADPTNAALIAAKAAADAAAAAAAAAATAAAAGAQIDFTDATSYNNATSVTAYDSKGQDVALTYYFQKVGTDNWRVYATVNGTTVSSAGTPPLPTPVTTITFSTNGGTPTTMPDDPPTFDIPATTNSVGAVTLPITGVVLNLSGATQYGAPFGVTSLSQDGFAPGQLTSVSIESTGILMARYSNGQSKPAGQIELATFRNPQGLVPQGGNAWASSFSSGTPVRGQPGDGNLGVLQSGALEESNVDLTAELVNMITAQRVYQANAQTIKTQDQMMQTLVNLR